MWLLIAFIAVPMIEIALFIQVGGLIGLGWTLAIVLGTALLGSYLMRSQGAQAMDKIKRSFNEMTDPTAPLAEGAMILFAGVLLLTPGFFTDTVGLLLLMPPVRHAVFKTLRRHVKVQSFSSFSAGPAQQPRGGPMGGDVIDGEYSEVDPDDFGDKELPKKPTHRPSAWTKH